MRTKIVDPKVKSAFDVFDPAVRKKLMRLRTLIFDVASETEGVGEIEIEKHKIDNLPQSIHKKLDKSSMGC